MELTKIKLLLITLIVNFSFISNAAILEEGSTIPVKLSQNINANIDTTGKTVYFTISEDIYTEGALVIKEGEFVKGFISEAVGRKSLGKGGKLTIAPKSMKTKNGQLIRFEQNPLASEGRKRTGATVAHVVMWGPLGLFAKGRAAFLMRGTEFDIVVDEAIDLKPYENIVSNEVNRAFIDVKFKKYSSKINFRKGKIGKDFILYIPTRKLENNEFNKKDVQLFSVNGEKLPKPIKAIDLNLNLKKNRYEAVFSFRDLVRYINPGSAEIVINIGNNYKAETSLSTKWKIK